MTNKDYIYFMYTKSEDAPYFYKKTYTYDELIETLNKHEQDFNPDYSYKFVLTSPDWTYVDDNVAYIERLPKDVCPEPFIPFTKKIFV